MSMEEGGIPCAAEGMGGCFRCPIVLQNKMSVLYLSTTASLSSSLSQTLTEPAIFARETSCDCRAPHEKLSITQARRGTPGTVDLLCSVSFLDTFPPPSPTPHLSCLSLSNYQQHTIYTLIFCILYLCKCQDWASKSTIPVFLIKQAPFGY